MNASLEKLAEQVLALPADARAELADRLAESLDPTRDDEVRTLWLAEAIRRRDEIRSGMVKPIDGEAALAQVHSSITR